MATSNHTTTFWNFLENYSIEIPIIQRDYAQGREKKESLRKKFLTDLKEALNKSKEMKLDFVYGSTENGKLYPLDGQQRLTTLWLLHWYIALRAGKLKEAAAHLMKFSYETRVSSREFCKALCNPDNFGNYHYDKDVIDFITNQTWFYSAWKQDPTIQSMLRMLGGSKNNISKDDGIEVLFGCDNQNCVLCSVLYNECIFDYYFDLLIGQDCPIVFYYLPKDFGNSDDLYIKMNARGEQLTAFENLKAAIDKILPKIDKLESFKGLNDANLKEKNTFDEQWKYCIDRQWTDIFWKYKENYLSDPPFLRFIANMLAAYWIGFKEINHDDDGEKDKLLRFFLGITGNEDYISYDKFKEVLPSKTENEENESDDKKRLETLVFLANNLNSFHKILELGNLSETCRPSWEKDGYDLIKNVLQLKGDKYNPSNKERAMFYALVKCPYVSIIETNIGDAKVKIKHWMRVFWNIVEQEQERVRNFIGAVRLINELSSKISDDKCIDIYDWLAEDENEIKSGFMKEQVKEERCKAKQILDENGNPREYNGPLIKKDGSKCKTWEDAIKVAEETAFFKGAIRFLFTDEKGEVNDKSWGKFDTKWNKASIYFSDKGVKQDYQKDRLLFKKFLKYISDFASLKEIYFDDSLDNWRNHILLNDKLCKCVDKLLTGSSEENRNDWEGSQKKVFVDLTEKDILLNIGNDFELDLRNNFYLLTKKGRGNGQGWKRFFIGVERNNILSKLYGGNINEKVVDENKIYSNQKLDYCDFFWGEHIDFKFNNHFFQWYGKPNYDIGVLDVYIMGKDEKGNIDYWPRNHELPQETTDNKKWFCFKVDANTTPEIFTSMLDCLIHQAKADEQNKPCCDDCQNKINGCLYETTGH